tara:strand:+ start:9749 stop:10942 length:1194 start_codon:yes stop_codon:yes gene_type:complete
MESKIIKSLNKDTHELIKLLEKIPSNAPTTSKIYNDILFSLYNELTHAETIVKDHCSFKNNTLSFEDINYFPPDDMPAPIQDYVKQTCNKKLRYEKTLNSSNKISITFYFYDNQIGLNILETYIKRILLWFSFAIKYSTTKCSSNINISIYLTNFKKTLPQSSIEVIDRIHANTAYTYRCKANNNIVIYRQEEWFKVLIHESMHYLGFDFNSINYDLYNLFPLEGKVQLDLGETYSETWARILNAYLVSFILASNYTQFKKMSTNFLSIERKFSIYQCVKILSFMGLEYTDLFNNSDPICIMKRKIYKERTPIFCYYILTCILMNNPFNFIIWCKKNNNINNIIKFSPITNVKLFVEYIKVNSLSKFLLETMKSLESLFKHKHGLYYSLRMSIIELD